MANQGALATLDNDQAIEQIANGAMLGQIAKRYGTSKVAVYKRLSKHPDYPEAMALQAHSFVQQSLQELMECDADTVNIARARMDGTLRYAKAHNEAYRDKQQIEHSGSVQIDFGQRLRAAERVIEGECAAPSATAVISSDISDAETS